MGWNHRVMRHVPDPSRGEGQFWYAIHEVYYPEDATGGLPVDVARLSYTEDPIAPLADNPDELRWVLVKMLAALDKPILDYRD